MKIHYRILGENKPNLFILHGLFGSSDNWQTLAKELAEHFTVYLVDQRNHGHSPHTEEFSYQLMAEDLNELLNDLNIEKANLLGHSMGGKTIIQFATLYPEKINKMLVLDISHKQYPMHHDVILQGLNSIDLSVIKTRGEADKKLQEYIDNFAIRQFLLKNLYWESQGQLGWRINIPVLTQTIHQIIEEIPFSSIQVETLFIRGELSNYIEESDYAIIYEKFPNSKIHTIHNVGHWVHAEAPKELFEEMIGFFS